MYFNIKNSDLSADLTYTFTAPNGEPITKIIFDAGSSSSYKLGIESVNAIDYETDFQFDAAYSLTDQDGDSDSGTVTVALDGDSQIVFKGTEALITGGGKSDVSDTLLFETTDTIDFGALNTNDGEAYSAGGITRLTEFETFDLGGNSVDMSLENLSYADVLAITDADNALTIIGDTEDSVQFAASDGWTVDGVTTADSEGRTFTIYGNDADNAFQLLVQTDIDDTIV